MNRVRLLVFNPVLNVLDYRVPEGMTTQFGALVVAPLGPRQVLAVPVQAPLQPAKVEPLAAVAVRVTAAPLV